MTEMAELIHQLKAWNPSGAHESEARLRCRFDPAPATAQELEGAYPGVTLPRDLIDFWEISRTAVLFEDTRFGQWGLRIFSPADSAWTTKDQLLDFPDKYADGDIVVGEFLGDLELLVLNTAPNSQDLLIRAELDPREQWESPASSLGEFLEKFLATPSRKFWN